MTNALDLLRTTREREVRHQELLRDEIQHLVTEIAQLRSSLTTSQELVASCDEAIAALTSGTAEVSA